MYRKNNDLDIQTFSEKMLEWSKKNNRSLPWKDFRDPYSIWISEIILQQTRVNQGLPYFLSFIERFPNVESLAAASEDEVLRAWEGLGYYSRARNLRKAAIQIMDGYKGVFPKTYKDLLSLKGVGPYTAAAIASFAYEFPYGVVDGNVKRVVARIFGYTDDIDASSTVKEIQTLVHEAVSYVLPSAFNQAIMDFGAMHCLPRNPGCGDCVFQDHCFAFENNMVSTLPFKAKKIKRQSKSIHMAVYTDGTEWVITQENSVSFWKGLYTFPMLSAEQQLNIESYELLDTMEWNLTHRKLTLYFYKIDKNRLFCEENQGWTIVKSENLRKFALPRPLRLFLNKNSCNLGLKENNDQQGNIDR
ncbi:A/G-specific adenine glycosylase [Membranihabitans marinus]|uniref:A/G-specific adenine glycosylase n=1 Tax=Membranihabitans marinus TaxID=1227546 RepID=UPI001F006ED2|nr:A/G-specific adenine glycosylase [Membranihabitans marinus]